MTESCGEFEEWRRLPAEPGSSIMHVRLSDALARFAGEPTTWWHWSDEPTVILGAGQNSSAVNREACAAAHVRVIKRTSGGTSVYADTSLLGLDVALPPGHRLIQNDVVESYRWLGDIWVRALALLEIHAQMVTVDEARAGPRHSQPVDEVLRLACFGSFSPFEVVVDGKKLVGLSQVRRAGRVLLQSGIYLEFHAGLLTRLLSVANQTSAVRELESVATGLTAVAGREVARAEVMEAFSSALRSGQSVVEVPGAWTADELAHAQESGI